MDKKTSSVWANCIPKNIDSFYAQNESLYNKLSFDIKRFVIHKELTSYEAMNLTSLIIQYNSHVMICHFVSYDFCKHH